MRISIKNSAGEVVLCRGDEASEYPESYSPSFSEQVQEAQGLRWPAAKAFGRLNFSTGVSFTVTREHADHRTACAFATDLCARIQALALVGPYTVAFVYQSDGGEVTRLLSDARVASFSCPPIGCSTISNFTLKGGVLLGGS